MLNEEARRVRRNVTFTVRAETVFGDSLVLVGGCDAFGDWSPHAGLKMQTSPEEYPLWTSGALELDVPVVGQALEYKFARIANDGEIHWETDGDNRTLTLELGSDAHAAEAVLIDDGVFGVTTQESFGYAVSPEGKAVPRNGISQAVGNRARFVIVGDAVAAGGKAWCYHGWAARFCEALAARHGQECGIVNLAQAGLSQRQVLDTLFKQIQDLEPKVVVLSFGLELSEQLVKCPGHQRAQVTSEFLSVMDDLVTAVWQIGALPVLGGLYPHARFSPEHTWWLRQAHHTMKQYGVPVLDWLDALSAGGDSGAWALGLVHDEAYPNSEGHRRMFAKINLDDFDNSRIEALSVKRAAIASTEPICFEFKGLEIRYSLARCEIIIDNKAKDKFELNSSWTEMRDALVAARKVAPFILKRGLYIAAMATATGLPDWPGAPASLAVNEEGVIETTVTIPASSSIVLRHSSWLFKPASGAQVLFYDGNLGVFREKAGFRILNEATCEYNVHPMWKEIRLATRKLSSGIYEDGSSCAFRTAVISAHGLQSRVKVPARSALLMQYTGPLSSLENVAVLPLGDRCSTRMLMHKCEYDGPCYPFDLTRTTSLADVADIVASGFSDMWNPDHLWYSHDDGRVFHNKWHGLSFAHEVEEGDDPVESFGEVTARMANRYSGRAARFEYACKHADRVLFLRTGCASREEVCDLMRRLDGRYPGLRSTFLLISDQPSHEFDGLERIRHVRESFDPDRMYQDAQYWIHCAHRFREILNNIGIDARSLYWCPSNLKEAERELQEAAAREEELEALPLSSRKLEISSFSHSKLYDIPLLQGA